MHGIPVGFNIGAKTNGPRPRLINEPREGWDKWELHPHVEDPVDAKRLPVMLKADAGYQEKIVKPRAKTSDGKTKAHQVIDAHKVILKVKDGLEIPASLYNVVIDHKISGNPHRASDGSTTFPLQYGVERLPDDGGTVIEPGNIKRLNENSLLVRYQGLEYVVITKTEISEDPPKPTPSSPK